MMPMRAQFRDDWHYAAGVISELAAPLLRTASAAMASRSATPPDAWRKGLILGSGHIGDVLYRTCSLDELASGLPRCEWSYATTQVGAAVLRGNPALSEILAVNHETATDFLPGHSARDFRARNFDVVLCTDNIAHQRALWLGTKLGIPNRVGFVQKGFSGLATIGVRTERAPWPAQIRTMVNTLTGKNDVSELRPRVYLDARDREEASKEWHNLDYPDSSLTIAAAVTSRQSLGLFPHSLFIELFRRLLDHRPNTRLVLVGTDSDRDDLEAIATQLGERALVRAGALSLRGLAAFLSLCNAFVGSDSGPRHLSNAVNIPVFFVRNLAVPEIEAGRYCETETDIAPPGQYLSNSEAERLLSNLDYDALASAIVTSAENNRAGRQAGLIGIYPGD
jgi:heptosyltransferase-2